MHHVCYIYPLEYQSSICIESAKENVPAYASVILCFLRLLSTRMINAIKFAMCVTWPALVNTSNSWKLKYIFKVREVNSICIWKFCAISVCHTQVSWWSTLVRRTTTWRYTFSRSAEECGCTHSRQYQCLQCSFTSPPSIGRVVATSKHHSESVQSAGDKHGFLQNQTQSCHLRREDEWKWMNRRDEDV